MIDYEKVDKLVENCKQLYPDMPDYVLWVLACDYYIHEENDEDEDEELKEKREQLKKEALESFLKAKEEFKTTKYENIKVV
jgi:Zn-dependent M16 (insulinase) family peptidase